jgi:hypothetical protein
MKNTNISEYGCSTLGGEYKQSRAWNFVIAGLVFIGILLIISFLTIPR